jgi:dTDP-4-dehydrorhamnose reductase
VDITDVTAVEKIIADEKPDFIINAAAIINMNTIEQNPALGRRVNVQGATAIARAAAARAIPQLFVSSSYVFGDSAKPYAEDAMKNPENEYGKTKAEAEDAVTTCGSDAQWYIVRSSWFYSAYRDTFVDEVAQSLLQGKPFEASEQRGVPTYGGEFAAAIVKDFIDSSPQNGVYHIVNEGGASRYKIAREIARALGAPESLVVAKGFHSSAMRPSVILKNTKLPKLPPWDKSLRAYISVKYGQSEGPSV